MQSLRKTPCIKASHNGRDQRNRGIPLHPNNTKAGLIEYYACVSITLEVES